MKPSAVILAGSRPGAIDPVAEAECVAHKCVATIDGQTLLERVVRALENAGIERIIVSANNTDVVAEAKRLGAEVLPTARGPSESVSLAFNEAGAPLLVTTADHALLQSDWIEAFLDGAPENAHVCVGLARREAVEAADPCAQRTWLSFADGQWSGCNLFLLAGDDARKAIAAWRQVEADRKRPWRIARRLGWSTLWSYWRGKLALSEAIAILGNRLGVDAALVEIRDGRAAIDVDKPADLQTARRLAAQASGPQCSPAPGRA